MRVEERLKSQVMILLTQVRVLATTLSCPAEAYRTMGQHSDRLCLPCLEQAMLKAH